MVKNKKRKSLIPVSKPLFAIVILSTTEEFFIYDAKVIINSRDWMLDVRF